MEEKIQIIDESGDRKYYTQIPNMVVNHSTAYEQSLYLIMKRIAGEKGSCYASINTLSKKMGAHKQTVGNTIKKLLARKWIKETEPVKVRGGSVRQFLMVDLWKINIEEYENGVLANKIESGAQTTTLKVEPKTTKVGLIAPESGSQNTSKNNIKEKHKNNYNAKLKFRPANMNKIAIVVDYYLQITNQEPDDYKRHLRAAKQLLELCDGQTDRACEMLDKAYAWLKGWGGEDFKIETAVKKYLELCNT